MRAAAVLVGSVLLLAACSDEPTGPLVTQTGEGPIPAQLESVQADVQRLAVALEGWSRDHGYATTLSGAIQELADAGLEPTAPNVVGGYEYDPEAVEFVLCVEHPDGAHATFDTQPMVVRTAGASGGCASD